MNGITVNTLKAWCNFAINNGCGDKTVLISCDDEGNGFHTLYYGFLTDEEKIKEFESLFHDEHNPSNVVLLG